LEEKIFGGDDFWRREFWWRKFWWLKMFGGFPVATDLVEAPWL
jgi:hypothetical protein